jgi:galactose-1-phosphate uridylyltransferase
MNTLNRSYNYFNEKNVCILCKTIDMEKNSERVLHESNEFICFLPYASQSPYQIFIGKHSLNFKFL